METEKVVPNVGDTVKVSIVGIVTEVSDILIMLDDGCNYPLSGFDFEVITPVEPAHYSIVVDDKGFAWQRDNEVWYSAGGHNALVWSELSWTRGPITVLREGKDA